MGGGCNKEKEYCPVSLNALWVSLGHLCPHGSPCAWCAFLHVGRALYITVPHLYWTWHL